MNRANIHVRNVGILFVFNICGEEVHVKRLDVGAPSSGQHCLESAITLAVTFERKDLLPTGQKKREQSRMLTRNECGVVPCPDYPLVHSSARFCSQAQQWRQ